MKKITIIIVLSALIIVLVGCADKNDTDAIRSQNQENGQDSTQSNRQDNQEFEAEDKQEKSEADEDKETSLAEEDNKMSLTEEDNETSLVGEDDIISVSDEARETISVSDETGETISISEEADKRTLGVETDVNDDKAANTDSLEQKLSELGEISKKLALLMTKGNFKETYDMFSLVLKPQISEDALKQAWDLTVTGMGSFIDLGEISEEKDGVSTVVYVILNFKNTGIRITFNYNSKSMLDGLWFNYAPYASELVSDDVINEIKISFGDKKNPIEGVLTLPKKVKNPPVAILVHGSGNHDADESIGSNKPFRDLAHGLARKGVAVIRYTESGLPKNKLDFTIQDDSLNDAKYAIKYAQSCGKVDKNKIIIIGHSLGGMMAPKIAADNKGVYGIVSLAGSPRGLEDIILDQNRFLLENDASVTEAIAKLAMAQVKAQVNKIKEIKESSSEIVLGYPTSYWYSLKQIDIPKIIKSLDIPIFIAQGSADFQVYADIDYVEWQELLKGRDKVTFRLYDNLNHLFMTSDGTMNTSEYNNLGTVHQKVIDDIARWINKN